MYVPLTGSDTGQTISYSAISSNSSIVATVMPSSNPTLVLDVSGVTGAVDTPFSGAMTFQLFQNLAPNTVANIENLVNSGEYKNNPAEFYRVLTEAPDQLIQGGIEFPGSNATPPSSIADEFNSALTFNSPGLLAMSNSGPNSGSSEFFITAPGVDQGAAPNSEWNFQYAIFGQLTSGFDIYNDILNAPLMLNPNTGEDSEPVNPISITSASIENDTQDGVVQISEPTGFFNSSTITITATGTDGTTAQQTFNVNPQTPTYAYVPDVQLLSTQLFGGQGVSAEENTAANLQVQLDNFGVTGTGTASYSVFPAGTTFGDPPLASSTGNLNVSVGIVPDSTDNNATITLTPTANFTGTLNLVAYVNYVGTLENGTAVTLRDDLPFTLTVYPTVVGASLYPTSTIDATAAGALTTTLVVQYNDFGATINPSTFGTGNVIVSIGTTPARVTGFDASGDTVTYTVAAPGGTWAASPQGDYTVSVDGGSVKDSNGNGVGFATLGQFLVDTSLPTWASVVGTTLYVTGQSSNDVLSLAFIDATDFALDVKRPVDDVQYQRSQRRVLRGALPGGSRGQRQR